MAQPLKEQLRSIEQAIKEAENKEDRELLNQLRLRRLRIIGEIEYGD